jgi:hypothetical protein
MCTLKLILRYPKSMWEEISTLSSLTKDSQLKEARRKWMREGSLRCSKSGNTVSKSPELSLIPALPQIVCHFLLSS